jgi:hypothetical protein
MLHVKPEEDSPLAARSHFATRSLADDVPETGPSAGARLHTPCPGGNREDPAHAIGRVDMPRTWCHSSADKRPLITLE